MKSNLKALGMVLVLGGTLMFTGCNGVDEAKSDLPKNETKVEEKQETTEKDREELTNTLVDGANAYYDTLSSLEVLDYDNEGDVVKALSNLSKENKEATRNISNYIEKNIWDKDSIEYKALDTIGQANFKMSMGLDSMITYVQTGDMDEFEESKEITIESKELYEKFRDEYASKLNVKFITNDEKKETETKKKKVKKEVKKEKTGQCYDCGEYYPVSKMTFNGRSYHCGCANVYCEECKKQIPSGEETWVGDQCYLCKKCFEKSSLNNTQNAETWTCPNCGRQNVGEVLCDCEME